MNKKPSSSDPRGILPRVATYGLAVGLLALGIVGLTYLQWTAPRPAGEPTVDPGRLVRACRVTAADHRVAVAAYGTSKAGKTWDAIAEVAGRIVHLSPLFDAGNFIKPGRVLARIDPTDYELAVQRHTAEVDAAEQQLAELKQTEANTRATLDLRERQLELARNELERIRRLHEDDQEPQSSLDAAESAYVQQRAVVQELQNALALVPIQRARLEASLELARTQLEEARVRLSKTTIKVPLPARCAARHVESDQYVGVGNLLGTFYSVEVAEIAVPLELRKLRGLLHNRPPIEFPLDYDQAEKLLERNFQLPAEVRWASGAGFDAVWIGKVTRLVGQLDPQTRSITVIVEVPQPYEGTIPGVRPPLLPNVFCEVTLYGDVIEDVLVLPREAVHDNRVYLIRDGRLVIEPIDPVVIEADRVVLKTPADGTGRGLGDGDMIVLADLSPAVQGMKLRAEEVDNPVSHRVPDGLPSPTTAPTLEDGA